MRPVMQPVVMQPSASASQAEFKLKKKLTAGKAAAKVFELNWKTPGGELVLQCALVKPVGVKELDAAMSKFGMHGIATQQMGAACKGYFLGEAESTSDLYLVEVVTHTGDSLSLTATLKAVSDDNEAVQKFAQVFKSHLASTGMAHH